MVTGMVEGLEAVLTAPLAAKAGFKLGEARARSSQAQISLAQRRQY